MAKRNLTKEEIKDICYTVIKINPFIPEEISKSVFMKIKKDLKEQLKSEIISPANIPKLKEILESEYKKSLIESGDCVGVLAAQSIGEKGTQTTLNSFHSAGIALTTMVTGIPRVNELLGATKNPKVVSCIIYFNKENKTIKELRNLINKNIIEINIENIFEIKAFEKKEKEMWYKPFEILYKKSIENYLDSYCICLNANMKLIYEYKISLKEIVQKIEKSYLNEYDICCIYSPNEIGQIHIFINLESDQIELPENRKFYSETALEKLIFLEDVIIPKIKLLNLFGIKGIKNINYAKNNEEWFIETYGSNLIEILCLPFVNKRDTYCNNVWEIYKIFGIEAAREFLIEEFIRVFSADGSYINERHIKLLVDMMTFDGNISSISRNGIKRGEVGPLCKVSFEESLANFLKAGSYGEFETTKGVSASVICGKRSLVGTGLSTVKMDTDKIMGDVKENF